MDLSRNHIKLGKGDSKGKVFFARGENRWALVWNAAWGIGLDHVEFVHRDYIDVVLLDDDLGIVDGPRRILTTASRGLQYGIVALKGGFMAIVANTERRQLVTGFLDAETGNFTGPDSSGELGNRFNESILSPCGLIHSGIWLSALGNGAAMAFSRGDRITLESIPTRGGFFRDIILEIPRKNREDFNVSSLHGHLGGPTVIAWWDTGGQLHSFFTTEQVSGVKETGITSPDGATIKLVHVMDEKEINTDIRVLELDGSFVLVWSAGRAVMARKMDRLGNFMGESVLMVSEKENIYNLDACSTGEDLVLSYTAGNCDAFLISVNCDLQITARREMGCCQVHSMAVADGRLIHSFSGDGGIVVETTSIEEMIEG